MLTVIEKQRAGMSVRTADVVAQAEKARVFSLRDAFAGAPAATAAAPAAHGPGRMRLPSATVPLTAASAAAPRGPRRRRRLAQVCAAVAGPEGADQPPRRGAQEPAGDKLDCRQAPDDRSLGGGAAPSHAASAAPTFAAAGARAPPSAVGTTGTTGTTGAPVRKCPPPPRARAPTSCASPRSSTTCSAS